MSDEHAKRSSEAVDQRHLELARAEGEAYQQSLRHLVEDVTHSGAIAEVGDYVVGIAQEAAAGRYQIQDGQLTFVEPSAENCLLDVAVADAADGRFVPHLGVEATLQPDGGEPIGPVTLSFTWHPGLFHYGANVTVPGDGRYDVRVKIDPARFGRRDEAHGDRYDEAVEVLFEDLSVECGQH